MSFLVNLLRVPMHLRSKPLWTHRRGEMHDIRTLTGAPTAASSTFFSRLACTRLIMELTQLQWEGPFRFGAAERGGEKGVPGKRGLYMLVTGAPDSRRIAYVGAL